RLTHLCRAFVFRAPTRSAFDLALVAAVAALLLPALTGGLGAHPAEPRALAAAAEMRTAMDVSNPYVNVMGNRSSQNPPLGINGCDFQCDAPFNEGDMVSVKANPDPGWFFKGWTNGECANTAVNPCVVTMPAIAAFTTANFAPFGQVAFSTGCDGTGTGQST